MGRGEGVKRLSCEPNVAFRGATGSQSIVVEGIEPVASVVYTQNYAKEYKYPYQLKPAQTQRFQSAT